MLRSSQLEPKQKAARLAVWGVIALVVGILWSGWLAKWFPGVTIAGVEWSEWPIWSPIIKNRWTSSYVLYAGGWSYLLLSLFYLIIDVYKFRWWIFPFRIIGVNALFAYLVYHICRPSLTACSKVFLGGLEQYTGEWHQLIMAFGTFLILWLILWFLYKKQTFIKL